MMRSMPTELSAGRRGERGAALVTSLLVAMLLLAAGGALVASAGLTASNAVDATAEAQAYYAADAGLQAALTVIRRNVASTNPANTDADFHHLACGAANPCVNSGYNLSAWLVYGADGLVELSPSPDWMAYKVTVSDPSKAKTDTLSATYQPRYLLVTSVGRARKGATKVLEMMVDRLKFAYDAPASLVLRESEDGTNHLTIDPGSGGPTYSGQDRNSAVLKGAVGAGASVFNGGTDFAIATVAMTGTTAPGGVIRMGSGVGETPWPSVVSDADTSRAFVAQAQVEAELAEAQGRGYSGPCPPNNYPLNGFIFISGDCALNSGNNGKGFMVATGALTLSGSYNFEGLVFALGDGTIRRNGGGGSSNGQIYGGILAASFGSTGGFRAVNFDSNGGGGSIIQYDSLAIENALSQFGPRALGIVEK